MNRKKLFYAFALLLMTICTSVSGTFAYFNYHDAVQNNISTAVGNIDVAIQSSNGSGSANLNIGTGDNFIPGKIITKSVTVRNSGTLTEKLNVGMVRTTDSSNIGQYLTYTMKVSSGPTTLMTSNAIPFGQMNQFNGTHLVYSSNQNPILLSPNASITINFDFTLSSSALYATQNKSINFDFIVKATQPNDPSWDAGN